MPMHYADFFCGCGGLSIGLAQCGWKCELAVDIDEHSLKLYSKNLKHHPVLKHDLRLPLPNTNYLREALKTGALVGGPSCQDFSTACPVGKRHLGTRAALTFCRTNKIKFLNMECLIQIFLLFDCYRIKKIIFDF